tara:strand:+ start:946 stop:1341 length:396 start_codon:yes stop_codon:yes gene_type:complete
MRKDIEIPQVAGVYVAAVKDFNVEHRTHDWNAYLINDTEDTLEMIMFVSKGYGEDKVTSQMRHKLDQLPAKGYAKVEFIEDSVLALTNEFAVTYFLNGKLFEKNYVFDAGVITDANTEPLPSMLQEGVLAK